MPILQKALPIDGSDRLIFTNERGCHFALFKGKKGQYKVTLEEPDDSPLWDYEDELDAEMWTREIHDCDTMLEACQILEIRA